MIGQGQLTVQNNAKVFGCSMAGSNWGKAIKLSYDAAGVCFCQWRQKEIESGGAPVAYL